MSNLAPQPGPQTTFFNLTDDVPLVFYGGAAGGGKSFALLLDCLKYADCPDFYGVYFRKTIKQLERTLWPLAKQLFLPYLIYDSGPKKGKYRGKAAIKEKAMMIVFPSGAKVEFAYLDRDQDCEFNWQGAQLTAAYFDEFTHFSQYVFNYIRTRMRSASKYKSFIRCSLNPHPTHFVHSYLKNYINDEGFAIDEYSAKPSYFVFDKGAVVTAWTEEELIEKYPNKTPRLFTFVPSKLTDNAELLKTNAQYAEDLEANDPANAAMLLSGNWKYSPAANGLFERSTIQVVDRAPIGCTYFRAWDKASSKPSQEGGDSKQLDPDYTASILFGKCPDGFIYILGNYQRDKDGQQKARIREKPGPRDKFIEKQAYVDGSETYVILPKDPGQSGVVEWQESAKKLQELGFIVKEDKAVSNQSKGKRFEPFASACYQGNVFWVKSSFDPDVWDYMILELENFDNDKNNGYHDDVVDCFSSAYATATSTKVFKAFSVPKINAPTMYHNM